MGSDQHHARRARSTLAAVVAIVLGVSLLASTSAAGQEGPPPTTAPPQSTTTTAPPVTVVLDEGDIGVVPPGSDSDVTPPPGGEPGEPGEPGQPVDGELEVPAELPVVILPDPTPGLNAALAAIDVGRARDALAESEGARRDIEAALTDAFEVRSLLVAQRRAAGEQLVSAKSVIDQLVVDVVIHGDTDAFESLLGQASLDDLRDRQLHGVAADKIRADFDLARAFYRDAVEAEAEATTDVEEATARARFVHVLVLGLRNSLDAAIREAEEARKQVGPPILGPAVLNQADLVAWYRTYYRADPPVGSIDSIIEAYLRVGEEEGVAGDIAFAQAILETGGFRSGHSQKWNFAGIGAYDSCSPVCSFSFPSLDDGVRAHIHLLRAYADPGLTTAQLAAAPNPQVAPERVGVRGCCQRWTQLTGVWASDPNYDRKVLGIYRLMVETARSLDALQQ